MIQVYEKPCKQCGHCCEESVCSFGCAFLKNPKAPCPAMEVDSGGKVWCGLITKTERFVLPDIGLSLEQYDKIREHLKDRFSFGVGCDAAGEKLSDRWIYKDS